MSDEEKKAIDELGLFIEYDLKSAYPVYITEKDINNFKLVLNLIKKQSKEIEELKTQNRVQRKQLNDAFNRGWIHEDKIKAKIEELDKAYEDSKNEDGESEYYYPNYTVEVLQSLLEKE